MYIKIGWEDDFNTLMMGLWGKYGRKIFTHNGIGDQLDLDKFSKDFFNINTKTTADVSVDDNSNVGIKSVITYNHEFGKPLQRYNSHYLLWKELRKAYGLLEANQIIEQQINGQIYINDFSNVNLSYCFNYSTYDIALMGLPMAGRIKITKPKSFETFIRQIEQFVAYASNSTLGATGIADALIVSSYFIDKIKKTGYDGHIFIGKEDERIESYVSERLRSLIYVLNWEFRATQSAFTNISIYDDYFLKDLVGDFIFEDGLTPSFETVKEVQELFLCAMNEELLRSDITFPIVTACIYTVDSKIKDMDFLDMIAGHNIKYGFINMYYGDSSTLSSCCRLRSDKKNEYFNSFGAGQSKIGSVSVVTQNFPRLAYMAIKTNNPEKEFFKLIRLAVVNTANINNSKRKIIKNKIDIGALPLYSLGFMDLSRQYSTFGINGLNESLEILGYDITSDTGADFVIEIIELINKENDKMAKRFKNPHNAEMTPSESSAVKLAERDRMLGYQDRYHLYSNQFIPLTTTSNMLDRLRLQGKFDKHFTGGAIAHINVGERIKDKQVMIDLMVYAAECNVVYWAVNYALKRCKNDHVFVDGDICPECGEGIDRVITRVVGFQTNVANWNKTRREFDFPNRQFYKGLDTNEYSRD